MKRYSLLSLLLIALAAGLVLSSASMAGEKCCKSGDRAACAPGPDKSTATSATCTDTQKQSCCPAGSTTTAVRSHSDHRQPTNTQSTTVSTDQQKCAGKVCVPCKPGEKCDGKPCKPGECRMAGGKSI